MQPRRECYNCGRTVTNRSAIETVDSDLWGDPIPVRVCPECYGDGAPPVQPAQPPLGYPNEPTVEAAA